LQGTPDYKEFQKKNQLQSLINAVTIDTANRLINKDTINRLKAIASGTYQIEALPENEQHAEAQIIEVVTTPEIAAEVVEIENHEPDSSGNISEAEAPTTVD
jgi:hypothetical protein